MASNNQMLAVAAVIAVAFLPLFVSASVHLVGDEEGWTLGFNYTAWSESNQFRVGEALGNKPFPLLMFLMQISHCITHHFLDQVMLSHRIVDQNWN
jgi:hypothetical protein